MALQTKPVSRRSRGGPTDSAAACPLLPAPLLLLLVLLVLPPGAAPKDLRAGDGSGSLVLTLHRTSPRRGRQLGTLEYYVDAAHRTVQHAHHMRSTLDMRKKQASRQEPLLSIHAASATPQPSSTLKSFGKPWIEFYVELPIGTPPQRKYLLFDTASDFTWVQCDCGRNCLRAPYLPSLSSTDKGIGCASVTCTYLAQSGAAYKTGCLPTQCPFELYYGSTAAWGRFLLENITLPASPGPGSISQAVYIGCASSISNPDFDLDGLVGMTLWPGSLLNELFKAKRMAPVLSFCLDSLQPNRSRVRIGSGPALPKDMLSAPLLSNRSIDPPRLPVVRMRLGSTLIQASTTVGRLRCNTGGTFCENGVLVDSGSSFTYLPSTLYNELLSRIAGSRKLYKLPPTRDIPFDCWENPRFQAKYSPLYIDFPQSTWTISNTSYLLPITWQFESGQILQFSCFAALNVTIKGISAVIGDSWIQDSFILMDYQKKIFGWSKLNCSSGRFF